MWIWQQSGWKQTTLLWKSRFTRPIKKTSLSTCTCDSPAHCCLTHSQQQLIKIHIQTRMCHSSSWMNQSNLFLSGGAELSLNIAACLSQLWYEERKFISSTRSPECLSCWTETNNQPTKTNSAWEMMELPNKHPSLFRSNMACAACVEPWKH